MSIYKYELVIFIHIFPLIYCAQINIKLNSWKGIFILEFNFYWNSFCTFHSIYSDYGSLAPTPPWLYPSLTNGYQLLGGICLKTTCQTMNRLQILFLYERCDFWQRSNNIFSHINLLSNLTIYLMLQFSLYSRCKIPYKYIWCVSWGWGTEP